ncbi:hypothetical protein [Anthocerotibacter panamensis]|uniref:hypothetical protein n=1 Tax=Anthocerotibacter panamensis TaxID=2857077 RepID=UPI001C40783E|nr:hypothetical protein [Anthocerotibacter panamensis]
MTREPLQSPIGWADLECLLSCQELSIQSLYALVKIVQDYGFILLGSESLLAYGDDPVTPEQVVPAERVKEFIAALDNLSIRHCILNFTGVLVDVRTPLSLIVDFCNAVVVVSIPENALWNFIEDFKKVDFRKLESFAKLCHKIATEIRAIRGYLGTEMLHREDMNLTRDLHEVSSPVDEAFFSKETLRGLFDWYFAYVCGFNIGHLDK